MTNKKHEITLGQLEALHQSIATGSFVAAAEALKIKLEKVKRRIEVLETAWGSKLLVPAEEESEGQQLTDVGEEVYELAALISARVEDIESSTT